MKTGKMAFVVALFAALSLFGLQQASARGWGGGCGIDCPNWGMGPGYQQLDDATRAKVDAFRTQTQDLRKQMAMKRAEKMALLNSETPDPQAVAKVEGELFDLHAEMQNRAREAGVPMMGMGMGMGRGQGMGPGMGRGMGRGMGPCFNQGWN